MFDTAWTASAFKGAHGPTLTIPPANRHLTNTINWLDLMGAEETKFRSGFRGLTLTGWQRYDHFAVLAELLPTGVPSLALDLAAAERGYFNSSAQAPLLKALECVGAHRALDEPIDLEADPFLQVRNSHIKMIKCEEVCEGTKER